jgi:glucokinase
VSSSFAAIGLDVGGTKALALLVDRDGNVLHELKTPTPHDDTVGAGVATARVLAGQIKEICAAHDLDVANTPVGVGVPGLVRRDGSLAFAPNLQSASGADFPALLRELSGSTFVAMENDGNAAAVAEHAWGAGRGTTDFAMITLGTGIGGGLIANGELVRGRHGFGGEVGHMIVQANGIQCNCGRRGCWERYASGSGLGLLAGAAARDGRLPVLVERCGGVGAVTAEDVTSAAAEGLEEAVALLDEVAWWLALGLSNLVELFDIDHFVISGGLSNAAGQLLPVAHRELSAMVMAAEAYNGFAVETSRLGDRTGALGAALVAFQRSA